MTSSVGERIIERAFFKAKVLGLFGQAYEDFFSSIMQYKDREFRPVKAQGAKGDGGNDGFQHTNGTYYQVYAPEHIEPTKAITKMNKDVDKIFSIWHPFLACKRFIFVLNDRYTGAPNEIEQELIKIKKKRNLVSSESYLCSHLEQDFCSLSDEERAILVGAIPTDYSIDNIKFPLLAETIGYVCKHLKPVQADEEHLLAPDFVQKLQFNQIPEKEARLLKDADFQNDIVEQYFSIYPSDRETVRDILSSIYKEAYNCFKESTPESAKSRFWFVERRINHCNTKVIQDCTLALMAYFFASCDIFEEPS